MKPVELTRHPGRPAEVLLRVTRRGITVAECASAGEVGRVLAEHGVALETLEMVKPRR